MTEQSEMRPQWLEIVCNRFDEVIEVLCQAPPTIIHGEYYPKNILLQDGLIYPVDWESTAISSGEIDLATLTEGWAPDEVERLELEYQRARWPEGPPEDFHRCLCAARIYIQFRWLGDRADWTPYLQPRLDVLREHAEEMGLI
jgi:thiamine kinase-like enzyme